MINLEQHIKRGEDEMAVSSIAICVMVRNAAQALRRNIKSVESIASKFSKAHIVVIENDSKDETKGILKNWAIRNNNVYIESFDTGSKTIEKDETLRHPKSIYFSKNRIMKMAKYRNMYLDIVSQKFQVKYLMAIDIDVHSFYLDGICSSFGFQEKWDSINSNGRKITPESIFYPTFYDTYAFQDIDDSGPITFKKLKNYQEKYKNLKKGEDFIQVNSGFNGLAIYKWESIKKIRYACLPNEDEIVVYKCEHITFHERMRAEGHDKIFLNPSQIVKYEKISPALYLEKLKNKLLR